MNSLKATINNIQTIKDLYYTWSANVQPSANSLFSYKADI